MKLFLVSVFIDRKSPTQLFYLMSSEPIIPPSLRKPPGCVLPTLPSAIFGRLVNDVRNGVKKAGLAYRSNPSWPFPSSSNSLVGAPEHLSIHILDSSFNPPTKAHLALALTEGVNNYASELKTEDTDSGPDSGYTANILLLSISNADKTLSGTDASYVQRLEMMVLMADSIVASLGCKERFGGVAIVVVNKPLFTGKQEILAGFLPTLLPKATSPMVDLVWQVGVDTLKRLFDAKYYDHDKERMLEALRRFLQKPNGSSLGGKIVCAQRKMQGINLEARDISEIEGFLEDDRVQIVEIGEWESSLSSSSVRARIRENDATWVKTCSDDITRYVKQHQLYISQQ